MVQKNFGKPVGIADLVAARLRKKTPLAPANLMRPPINPSVPPVVISGGPPRRRPKAATLGMMAGLRRRF